MEKAALGRSADVGAAKEFQMPRLPQVLTMSFVGLHHCGQYRGQAGFIVPLGPGVMPVTERSSNAAGRG